MIDLSKSQVVNLSKEAKQALRIIRVGVGWDVASGGFLGVFGGGGNIDLDASVIVLDANRVVIDTVWFGQKRSRDGAIRHSGDNLTGAGDGDDETIIIDTSTLNPKARYIAVTVNSFRGQKFDRVKNAYAAIYCDETKTKLAQYNISDSGPHTGFIIGIIDIADEVSFTAKGERAQGRVVADLIPLVKSLI